jgi:hypothetical protein
MRKYGVQVFESRPGRWRARLRYREDGKRVSVNVGTFDTEDEARAACDKRIGELRLPAPRLVAKLEHKPARVEAADDGPLYADDEFLEALFDRQRRRFAQEHSRNSQKITLPAEPCAVALLSDTHFGNDGTDVEAAFRDAHIVARTPGMYAGFHGDIIDNWIIGKLQSLQRGQAVDFGGEIRIARLWLEQLGRKLIYALPGNHELWSARLAGIDILGGWLAGRKILYDPHELNFSLNVGSGQWKWRVRHKWKGKSLYNDLHGLFVGWERGTSPYEIAVGGHTHAGTLFGQVYKHEKVLLGVLTGSYKQIDPYARENGFEKHHGRGCGAIVFHPDGRRWMVEHLDEAAEFVTWLRAKAA